MPPRRRKPASPAPPAQQAPVDRASSPPASDHEGDSDTDPDSSDELGLPELRLFNTTFSTYRASPLYVSANLGGAASAGKQQKRSSSGLSSPQALQILSKRLRDTLVGDVVRGVQVGLGPEGDSSLGRTGALMNVDWRWVGVESLLGYDGESDRRRRAREREGSEELGNNGSDDGRAGAKPRSAVARKQRALCLSLAYESANFNAFLLPDLDESSEVSRAPGPSWSWQTSQPAVDKTEKDSSDSSFVHLPLLLLRMPAPLKTVLVEFLSSTFDCRVSPLRLGTRTLVRSWEAWLSGTGRTAIIKDAALTLGFHVEPPSPHPEEPDASGEGQPDLKTEATAVRLGLKSIDVIIPAIEVRRFARVGREARAHNNDNTSSSSGRKRRPEAATPQDEQERRWRRRKLAGGRDEEGWEWRSDEGEDEFDQPFTEALAAYLDAHLALDLFHPGVRVLRVACDGFALSEGGRAKVFAPARGSRLQGIDADAGDSAAAAWAFVRDLARHARGREWRWKWK